MGSIIKSIDVGKILMDKNNYILNNLMKFKKIIKMSNTLFFCISDCPVSFE